jgi:hypothetical protein
MGVECASALGAVAPWRVRPGQHGEAAKGRRRWHSPASVLKDEEEARWADWAKRPSRPVRRLGRLGQKLKEFLSE